MKSPKNPIIFILPFIALAAITGIITGWTRLGWNIPLGVIAGKHGAVMVGSFLGTLICLERAVIIKNKWILFIPLVSGSSIFFFYNDWDQTALSLLTIASFGQVAIIYSMVVKHKDFFLKILLLGAFCWLIGNLLLLIHGAYPIAVPWWIGFLLLTITAERLELSRFLPVTNFQRGILVFSLALFVIGCIIPFHIYGRYLAGAGIISIGIWLLKYDMAKKAIKKEGLHRFSGLLLLTGYSWLIASGIFFIVGDLYGFIYDAALHSFFIGFVFSMIFAHAPIVLPGVAGYSFRPFHPILYIWAVSLQLSVLIRILAAINLQIELRMWAGMANGITIILFLINMAILTRMEIKKEKKSEKNQLTFKYRSNG
jgi:hypothetical protein